MKTTTLLIIAAALSSCTVTFNPDGSRTYGVDHETAKAIIVEYTK